MYRKMTLSALGRAVRRQANLSTTSRRRFSVLRSSSQAHSLTALDLSSFLELRVPKRGTGFDNFLGGEFKTHQSDDKNRSSGGGGNNNNNNDDNTRMWLAALSLFGLTYLLSRTFPSSEEDVDSLSGASSSGMEQHPGLDHREISWHDFLRLLQQQDVVKVLVAGNDGDERQSARIYLRSNAKGLTGKSYNTMSRSSQAAAVSAPSAAAAGTSSSYEQLRRSQAPPQPQKLHLNHPNSEFEQQDSTIASEFHYDGGSSINVDSSGNAATNTSARLTTNPGIYYYRMPIGSIESFEHKLEEAQRALGRDPTQDVPVQYMSDTSVGRELMSVVPGVLLAAMLFGMMRFAGGGGAGMGGTGGRGGMGGIFQIGKSTHKKISKEDVSVNFGNVAGCDEAKKEIMEFVDFLKDSDRFTKLGAKIPKGALLCGPPGTGKTLLAKAGK
jgi:hypothetical protein